mgnify:CR=1 FL=1
MNRILYIDYLRNFANITRCFIHASVPYMVTVAPIWPVDDGGGWFFDFMTFEVHLFVMELFFVISGFFFAKELFSNSRKVVLKNRFKRIVIPFLLGVVIIVPIVLSCFPLGQLPTNQSLNFEYLRQSYIEGWVMGLDNFFPTGHLWFLYYLIFFYAIGLVFKNRILSIKINSLSIIMVLGIMVSLLCMAFMKRWIVDNPITLVPELPSFIHYFMFFLSGMFLFKSKNILNQIKIHAKRNILIGCIMGLLAIAPQPFFNHQNHIYYGLIEVFALISCNVSIYFLVFGFWGVFGNLNLKDSKAIRYLTDSSYWVYLSNMPIVMLIQIALMNVDISIYFKFIISFFGAFVLSMLSYEYLVRYSFIGGILNKKRNR